MLKIGNSNKITILELPDTTLVNNLDGSKKTITTKTIAAIVLIVTLGVLTGFLLSRSLVKQSITPSEVTQTDTGQKKLVVGSSDTKTFRDSAEGTLDAGGVNGEGTHRLIRPGGESQTVYLTS